MVIPIAIIKEGINTNFQLNPKLSFRTISIKVGVIVAISPIAISPIAISPNVKNIEPNMILIAFISVLIFN
jgi:hypothetical protein